MMKTTMVRTAALVLAAVVAGTVAGCGVSVDDSGTDGQESRSAATAQEPSTGGSATPPSGAETSTSGTEPSVTRPYGGDVQGLLTPPGATVVAASPGSLVLTSSDSVDSLAGFYDDALARLGAQQSESAAVGAPWGYSGTYDDGESIEIAVLDVGEARSIAISY